MNATYSCPACGYRGLAGEPWADDSPSDEICPCCGIQFGYDDMLGDRADLRPAVYVGWRLKWRLDGMRWWSSTGPPPGWSSEEQWRSIHDATLPPRNETPSGVEPRVDLTVIGEIYSIAADVGVDVYEFQIDDEDAPEFRTVKQYRSGGRFDQHGITESRKRAEAGDLTRE